MQGIGADALNRIILIGIILQGGWIIYYLLGFGSLKSLDAANAEISLIRELVNNVEKNDPRPVLFLYQTQLIATKTIQGVSLVANLDNMALLDFSLSNSPSLLSDYIDSRDDQDFSFSKVIQPDASNLGSWISFKLDEPVQSLKRSFLLTIQPYEDTENDYNFSTSQRDEYEDGVLWINGVKQGVDLLFQYGCDVARSK